VEFSKGWRFAGRYHILSNGDGRMKPGHSWTPIGFFVTTALAGAAWAWADYRVGGAIVLIVGVLGLIGTLCYQRFPSIKNVRLRRPWVVDVGLSPGPFKDLDKFGSLTLAALPPPLAQSLYVSDIRLTFDKLKKDRRSELTMSVFNGSGRVVEIGNVSGQITFNSPNNTYPNRMGVLQTPALHPDVKRTAVQLEEWRLIFAQHVPSTEADKLLAMIKSNAPIHFDLSGLKIEVFPQEDRSKIERLPLWDGVSSERGREFGRIAATAGHASSKPDH
jgi:hypothetical protein